jgi:cytochrome bd ubiquinol oxidase subunit II
MEFPNLDLHLVWFLLVGVLFTGYAMLDGFDLGVGALHLFAKKDEERRILLNAIGPVWDGNEVWLVTGGGALFAAFPPVYASTFSGFYLAFMLLLAGLIFRAVAIEFRSKRPERWWRQMWDIGFCGGSVLSSFVIGVAMGNLVWGVPLDANGEFAGSLCSLLHPYALLLGATTVALFCMHGAIYALMKTDGHFHTRIRRWINPCIVAFIMLYAATSQATLLYCPHMTATIKEHPAFFAVALLNMLAIANIPRAIHRKRDFEAFLSSCTAMIALMGLCGAGLWPNLLYSNPHPELSLTAYNASSSTKTLGIMLTIGIIGIPIVLAYTVSIYWIFRGKVQKENLGY